MRTEHLQATHIFFLALHDLIHDRLHHDSIPSLDQAITTKPPAWFQHAPVVQQQSSGCCQDFLSCSTVVKFLEGVPAKKATCDVMSTRTTGR